MRVTAWEYACDWPRINEEQSVSSAKDGTAFMGLTRIRPNYWAFKGAFFGSNQLEVRRAGVSMGRLMKLSPRPRRAIRNCWTESGTRSGSSTTAFEPRRFIAIGFGVSSFFT